MGGRWGVGHMVIVLHGKSAVLLKFSPFSCYSPISDSQSAQCIKTFPTISHPMLTHPIPNSLTLLLFYFFSYYPCEEYLSLCQKKSITGSTCRSTWMGPEIQSRRVFTSCLISRVLNGKDMFGKYLNKLKTIVTTARHGVYVYLHNIMRLVQPIIMEDTVNLHILKIGCIHNLSHTMSIKLWPLWR